jgi:hypothetical protein
VVEALSVWKFAIFAAAALSLAWGRREVPANVSGPMDGARASRQPPVVGVTAIGDPSGLLERERSRRLARQIVVALESELGARGTEILSLAAAAPCTAACLAEAKARSAGEVLEVSVERRPETLAVVLRRIRTRTAREYGSVATGVGSDGDVPNLVNVLSKLFPPSPHGVRLGEEDGGIAPAFARAAAPPQPVAPPRPAEPTASAASARRDQQRIADLVREVQHEVEAVRGIRSPAPLHVDVLDDGGFERALRRSIRSGTRKLVQARLAKWIAFGIAPNGVDPEEAEEHAQLGAGLLGFYDPATKKLYVRRDQAGESEEEKDRMLRRVVAHEIEHALQDRAFHLADLLKIADDEARLALKALYEGEATAVETAWEAREKHLPVRFVVAEEAAARKRLDDAASLQANGYSGSVRDAPLILQEELILQYVHGFALVAEVLKNGGFRSVDQMFRNPPRTTAQVSNPALYFRGQMPLVVARPEAPRATRVVSTGSMGALGTRVALQVCGDPSIAASVAAELAGDAYTVVERRDGSLGVLWNTAWTKPEDATRFATMIELQKPCWETSTLDSPKNGWRISAEYSVQVSGTQVAFVRGFKPAESAALASRAATFTVGGSRSGGPRLAGAEGFRKEERATLSGSDFVDPRLSLRGTIGIALEASVDDPGHELVVESGDGRMYAEITFVPRPASDDARKKVSDQVTSFAMHFLPGRVALAMMGESPIRALGRAAQEYRWTAGRAEMKLATVPVCSGKAFIAIFRIYRGDGGKLADDFFNGLSLDAKAGDPPVCSLL